MNPGRHVLAVVGILVGRGYVVSIDPKRREVNVMGERSILHVTWETFDQSAAVVKDPEEHAYAQLADWLETRCRGGA